MSGRTKQKGVVQYVVDGFRTVRELDNTNVYGVMLSEMVSNIFKEGMWFKALTPYMLILTNNDPVQVGNMMSLNGLTRAIVGIAAGQWLINDFGIDTIWLVAGMLGFCSLLINVVCLSQSSVGAAYILNFFWAIYNGLWNSCLETTWSRSTARGHREDVNGARQITNKITTAMGPLFSAMIFMYWGNTWDIGLVQRVMLLGTAMTTFTVVLCFCFRESQEIVQEVKLQDVESINFDSDELTCFECKDMRLSSFKDEPGIVQLTYPIAHDTACGWASRIKVVTSDFKETDLVLVKQYHASFNMEENDITNCFLVMSDRRIICVDLLSMQVFLSADAQATERVGDGTSVDSMDMREMPVSLDMSTVKFQLNTEKNKHKKFEPIRVLSRLVLGYDPVEEDNSPQSLFGRKALLTDSERFRARDCKITGKECASDPKLTAAKSMRTHTGTDESAAVVCQDSLRESNKKLEESSNMLGAKMIVCCDVLNALGAGFSLKFMDLFLKVDYGVSPAGVFMVAFFQNIFGAWFTPYAKKLLAFMRERGYRAKLGVVLLWCLALFFLGLLIIPDMPLPVVMVSIVMMQSLNSCTRAYNRAQLVNYLPRDKIPKYMSWDALNKANQGGIAIFGAQVVSVAGYRGCFMGTFILFAIRIIIYLAFTLRKGTIMRGSHNRPEGRTGAERDSGELISSADMNAKENIKAECDGSDIFINSQLFSMSESLSDVCQQRKPKMHPVVNLDLQSAASGLDQWDHSRPGDRAEGAGRCRPGRTTQGIPEEGPRRTAVQISDSPFVSGRFVQGHPAAASSSSR